MTVLLNIVICIILSFSYIGILTIIKLFVKNYSTRNYVYIWSAVVTIIAFIYPHSYLREFAFDNVVNTDFAQTFLIIAIVGILLSRFSGYQFSDKRSNFEFSIMYPVFEEILFRGTILPILISCSFIYKDLACIICGMLFGIQHFQYFGLKTSTVKKVLIATIGGYFFARLTVQTQLLLPAVLLHFIFNTSALLFTKTKRHLQE